ncbi:MAG: glycerate kinase [Clostridia bacterium]|nr:glycerate kinase [Clostridia bacterium]
MKFIFAPDSFKGSLSAEQIVDILQAAAQRHFPGCETDCVPVADGGEGTVRALARAGRGELRHMAVHGPLMEPAQAEYGVLPNGTYVFEMAQASGLPMVPPEKRDPRNTTSYGVGELIARALSEGAKHILIGIGGSATNDGGMGLLAALGARFLDGDGAALPPVGGSLAKVATIDLSGLDDRAKSTDITVISDVTNPLTGPTGATYIYGPQKGATSAIADALEAGMAHYARKFESLLGHSIADFPGAGAAGGLGAALKGVLGARMRSGIEAVLDAVHFDGKLDGADLVVTGEGRIDRQTAEFGKVPAGVLTHAARRGVPVVILAGSVGPGAERIYDLGPCAILPTVPSPMPLERAMAEAEANVTAAADRLFRLWKLAK